MKMLSTLADYGNHMNASTDASIVQYNPNSVHNTGTPLCKYSNTKSDAILGPLDTLQRCKDALLSYYVLVKTRWGYKSDCGLVMTT